MASNQQRQRGHSTVSTFLKHTMDKSEIRVHGVFVFSKVSQKAPGRKVRSEAAGIGRSCSTVVKEW